MKPLLPLLVRTCVASGLLAFASFAAAASLLENLGRGVVAVRTGPTEVFVSWRILGTDPGDITFNLYRSTGGGTPTLLNASPLTGATHFVDNAANLADANAYFVRPIVAGVEQTPSAAFTLPANAPTQQYLRVPLDIPANGVTPDGLGYAYNANDTSVGDVDGDGEYEFVVKWEPTNTRDSSQDGYTGNTYLDAYRLDGTRLWRIDLGVNVRAGPHDTPFIVFDLDGDGRAEVALRTGPGTRDGLGNFVADPAKFFGPFPSEPFDHNADYRNGSGRTLVGPEFLTIFDGLTGAELASTKFLPARHPDTDFPTPAQLNDIWGDNFGNRANRFYPPGIAYLDGQRPSLVFGRGYAGGQNGHPGRIALAAWNWRDGQITPVWTFDSRGRPDEALIAGQGAHSASVADLNGDGRDDIVYGQVWLLHDGTLHHTAWGHGDALHVSNMDPDRPDQQVFMPHESPSQYGPNALTYEHGSTGELIFGVSSTTADIGRGVAADVDPRFRGFEIWGSGGTGGLYNVQQWTPNAALGPRGVPVAATKPGPINKVVWWDGDLLRELLDGTTVSKWNWITESTDVLFSPPDVTSNNGTKSNPSLQADLFGDWREEIIWRESTNAALRIYTTTLPTTHRFPTLMHDRQYRVAIAFQNVGYNQPPHTSFYLGDGMAPPPAPDIVTSLAALPTPTPAVATINRHLPATLITDATSVIFRVTFNVAVTGVDVSDFSVTTTGGVAGAVTNVSSLGGIVYDVTIGGITGSGSIRLDLNPSGTGITGPGGVPIAGGFTSGQIYNRATLAWINPVSGGLWSDPANWDGGVIADGAGARPTFGNFDVTTDNTVVLDSPRTLSGLTFGDTDPSSAASWTISDNGNPANTLTLATESGLPIAEVDALGTGATATIAAGLAGNDGLAKAGGGTLVLTKPATLAGQVNVTAGTLRFATGSAIEAASVTVSNGGATLEIDGGAFTAVGNTTVNGNGGRLIVNAGSGTFAGVATNNTTSGLIRVNGGTFHAHSINLPRSSDGTPSFAFGFVVTSGDATVDDTIGLGTNNSWGSMSIEGGSLAVGGGITIGNQATSGRGGQMRVTGGTFVSTDTTEGVVISRRSGNVARANFTGGTSSVERFILGFSPAVNSGSGTLTIDGGTVYLGSGGIVTNGSGTFAPAVNLSAGILGAKATWSTALPITLPAGGNIAFKAADASDEPFDITLNGALSGAGGFTKSGGGTLTLTAANTFAGAVTLNDGTLRADGSIGAGAPIVLDGGTLAGTGTIEREVVLNTATIAPDGTAAFVLNGPTLTWNNGGQLAVTLGASGVSGQLLLAGALNKGSPGSYPIVFTTGPGFAAGNGYTLATFASTNFNAADFSAAGLPPNHVALFSLTSTSLQVTVKAIADITLADLRQFYDGTPKTPTAITNPGGLDVAFTFNGSTTAPALPGTYEVVATIADPAYVGSASGTFVITTTAVVRHAPIIGGGVDGSAQQLLPESVTLSGDVSHDLLVPGTPTVRVNGNPTFVGVQEATGSATPTNHFVTLNGGAVLRYVVRRVDAVSLPVVVAPLPPSGTRSVVLNNANQSPGDFATLRNLTLNGGAGAVVVPPGAYGTFLANGSGRFVFGVTGSTTPAIYHLQQFTLNGSARLDVVGPVIVRLGGSFTFASTVGSAANPRWLTLELASAGVTLNTGATLHGEVIAPNGTVILNSAATLNGNLAADRLIINSNGLLHETAP